MHGLCLSPGGKGMLAVSRVLLSAGYGRKFPIHGVAAASADRTEILVDLIGPPPPTSPATDGRADDA